MIGVCSVRNIGDGYCNSDNNNAICAYDGGDCCECTCVADYYSDDYSSYSSCANNFACIDPEAPCVDDDDITINTPESCDRNQIGDGWCDEDNNIAECNYDGGDCCECTCMSDVQRDDDWTCGRYSGFACIDPSAPCVDDDSVTVDMIDICRSRDIGDGYCDDDNNNADCAYDGGDCCECTC
ncbi:unnamed protein product, partial [Scytosiphon promiscuus]